MFLGIPPIPNQPTTAFRIHGLQIGHVCIVMKQMISRFVWLPTKTVNWTLITLTKHLSSMDFRTRRMLVLPSRNTILQSAMIGIDKNFCLFGLRLYARVNKFTVMSGRSHRFFLSFFLSILSRSNFDHHLRCGGWLNFEFS